ncbi:M15 family metallopeptidase [Acinetobacter sp. ANC 4639]
MLIFIIFSSFFCMVFGLAVMMSYELRIKLIHYARLAIPSSKIRLLQVRQFACRFRDAAVPENIQNQWYLQQWWILIASFSLCSSIVVFALTRNISSTKIEAEYLKEVDPQIYTLLHGEMLTPPAEVDESLIQVAIVEATQLEQQSTSTIINANSIAKIETTPNLYNSQMVDRKWDKINQRYKQRLLMVFKIMKERYGYDLVLLEGYRSPERQNLLSGNPNTTRAKGYQSYHQFGLAADVAFQRNGKVVISERDPWAMRGYELYGEVAESVGLTWGGRWKAIKDLGHTEYRMPSLKKTKEMADKLIAEEQSRNTPLSAAAL